MKIEPTCGASPFGRNSSAVSGNAAKRAWLASVWSRKVWSTVNPFVARRMAGCNVSRRDSVPKRSSAASQVASVPGTPTERPDDTASANGYPTPNGVVGDTLPGITKASLGMSAGAVSRPSIVVTSPVAASKYTK